MILFFAACQTLSPVDAPADSPPTVQTDIVPEGFFFETLPSIELGSDRVLGAGDVDGDGRQELFGTTDDAEVVLWRVDEGDVERTVLTRPLAELTGHDDAWVSQMSGSGELVVSFRSLTNSTWIDTAIRVSLDGRIEILAQGSVANVTPLADVDGDGLSEWIVQDDDGVWFEPSAGARTALDPALHNAWALTPLVVDEGILVLHNGGYGIFEAWLLTDEGQLVERIHGIYGYALLTDGGPHRSATEVLLNTSGDSTRFDGHAFVELSDADEWMVAGALDGLAGGDLIGLVDGEPVGWSAWEPVPVTGLPAEIWDWQPADLDGDGRDDLVRTSWTEQGAVLELYANRSR